MEHFSRSVGSSQGQSLQITVNVSLRAGSPREKNEEKARRKESSRGEPARRLSEGIRMRSNSTYGDAYVTRSQTQSLVCLWFLHKLNNIIHFLE